MERYRVKPGAPVDLDAFDPNDNSAFEGSKKSGEKRLNQLCADLDTLQELLYAEHRHRLLIVLQGMDTAGKDGTIRHVFQGVNPQGVHVASFKTPTSEELDHDYLWRIHAQTPAKGEMVIFNRSHYEDVLIVRVHKLVDPKVWRARYSEINHFEEMLANEGTMIRKFFLHVDADEQKNRLEDRLRDASKHWKFNPDDLKERKLWPEYMKAYQDALSETSTAWAPWYIVPSNRKWYRNLVVSNVIVDALKSLKMEYPKPAEGLDQITVR
ncbi:MAG: polyphosphate kinase 2 family protein [Chloroflexi bacterium]|nr:polyphosphate kinase 2 family protein [Chloroflexota bacterium]